MRVLMINKFYYLRGGTERYVFDMTRVLERHGHEVIPFAMRHAENRDTHYSTYFVEEISLAGARARRPLANMRAAVRAIYSREAGRRLDALIEDTRPDVAYLHNIHHQLSLSILPVLGARGVPTVWRLHDYSLHCPNGLLFSKGAVCERCRGHRYHECFRRVCRSESRAASLVAALASYSDRWLRLADPVGVYVAPSRFLLEKMVELGLDRRRLRVSPNFIDVPAFDAALRESSTDGRSEADGLLYCGRLSREKGVNVLIRAMAELPDCRLWIAGDGPQRRDLEALAASAAPGRVAFVGRRSTPEVLRMLREARIVIAPSVWYENCPYAILEAFAAAKPVIASQIGGIPELVEDGTTGRLFPPGDAGALAEEIRRLWSDRDERRRLGENARARIERDLTAEAHYAQFMDEVSAG
jgi:glycosyltransferase involved in cell wall biosynthesis